MIKEHVYARHKTYPHLIIGVSISLSLAYSLSYFSMTYINNTQSSNESSSRSLIGSDAGAVSTRSPKCGRRRSWLLTEKSQPPW